jgi:hypothetical protein
VSLILLKRTKLHRLIKNLITKATTADDVLYTNGNIIKEGTSGLSAIQEIINRLEGTPSQKITGPRRRHVELDWMGRWVPICVDELPALAGWRLVAKIKHMGMPSALQHGAAWCALWLK